MSKNAQGGAARPSHESHGVHTAFVVGAFRFPHGDSSAQRLLTLAQTAAAAGYRPLVINDEHSSAPEDYVIGEIGTVDGVDFICLPGSRGGRLRRLTHRATRPLRVHRVIRRLRSTEVPSIVSVASGLCTLGLLLSLRGRDSVLIADVVERHDPSQFPRGRLEPYFIRHRWTSTLSRHLADRVIVISSTLAAVFAGGHQPPLVLPPLVDLDDYAPAQPRRSNLDLVYVGNPRGKDQLGVVLDAVASLDPSERAAVHLTIAGADEAALAANPDVGPERMAIAGTNVSALGYVGRPEVLKLLANADFSVLIRPNAGYAASGFPSKVPESLAAGCPVLCNLTTDLAEYLVDGENALVCPTDADGTGVTVESLTMTLRRAIGLHPEAKDTMARSARKSADALSTLAWGPVLASWLEEGP